MVRNLRLTNFKVHRQTAVALDRLSVLVGPNGAGKTTALEAIHYVGQLADGKPVEELFSHDRTPAVLRRSGTSDPWTIETTSDVQGRELHATVTWPGAAAGQPPIDDASPSVTWGSPDVEQLCRDHNRGAALFRLDARIVAAPGSSSHPSPRVEFDGRNTAAALKAIKLGHDDLWAQLVDFVRGAVPGVKSLGVELVGAHPKGAHEYPSATSELIRPSGEWYRIIVDFDGARRIPASVVSEGTLLLIALATILVGPARPRTILLDDIEQGLHPVAQRQLMKEIGALLERPELEDVQVLATTHSPYILDPLKFAQVQVFAKTPSGDAAVKSLAEHPDASRLEGVLAAGELWSADSEYEWVLAQEHRVAL